MKFRSKISASWLRFSGNVACNGKVYPVTEVTDIKLQTNSAWEWDQVFVLKEDIYSGEYSLSPIVAF